tara:strand:- start:2043 stop:3221 length:1179 start_codon:yes stop_codon:yes gene_type:complete
VLISFKNTVSLSEMNNKFRLHNTLIVIGKDALLHLRDFIIQNTHTKIFVFVDQNTKKYCLPHLLNNNVFSKRFVIVELDSFATFTNSESLKSMNIVTQICKYLLCQNIDKNSLIINLGGGVICDLGGFVASIIKRGVKFINVPTTFMSQIDASIGGKVAVNLNNYKNQIGVFSNPESVVVYPDYNQSLDDFDFHNSLAEVLKYGLIYNERFWKNLTTDSHSNLYFKNKIITKKSDLKELILECVKMKISIVKSDYYDLSDRRKLNFGHSISHALESCFLEESNSSTSISHGSALALGMICETYLSYKKFKFSENILHEIVRKISKLFRPINYKKVRFSYSFNEYLKLDKKNKDGVYQFTLIKTIGCAVVNVSVSDLEVLESLDFYDQIYSDG